MQVDGITRWLTRASAVLGVIGLLAVAPHGSVAVAANAPVTANLCRLLTTAEVGRALKVTVVRAEGLQTEEVGCEFSAKGNPADATSGHTVELAKSAATAHGTKLDSPTEDLIAALSKGLLKGSDADTSATAAERHPGEIVVLTIEIQPGDADDQMDITRSTMTGLSPTAVTTVTGLGDQAFDTGGARLTVKKGKTMIQFTYPGCTCTTRDVVPLARKVVNAL